MSGETSPSATSWRGAPTAVVTGTIVSAALGWALLVLAARILGPHAYADFAVLWAFFFAASGLLAGVQQEVTKAVARADAGEAGTPRPVAHRAILLVGLAYVVLAILVSPWAAAVFPTDWPVVLTLATLVLIAYAVQSAAIGVLAARWKWASTAAIAVVAAALRLVVVVVVCLTTPEPAYLILAIGAGAAALVLVPAARSRHTLGALGVTPARGFAVNTVATMGIGLCASLITSGLPFLTSATGGDTSTAYAGSLFAGLTTLRTPMLMPLLALQLVLVTYFVAHRDRMLVTMIRLLSGLALTTVLLAAAAHAVGPPVLHLLLGRDFDLGRGVLACLVVSAGLLGCLIVSSTALVSQDRNLLAAAGWVLTLVLTLLLLVAVEGIQTRLLVASVVAPAAGLGLHLAGVAAARVRR